MYKVIIDLVSKSESTVERDKITATGEKNDHKETEYGYKVNDYEYKEMGNDHKDMQNIKKWQKTQ